MALIRNRQIEADAWQHLSDSDPIPGIGAITVSFERLQAEPALVERSLLGIRVSGEAEPEPIEPFLTKLSLICVNFPKFTDGRGYSLARLLRERFGYKGELRATGDVLYDQLFPLMRCGFDAFELKVGKDAKAALDAFETFSTKYQAAVDEPLPNWRRRAANAP